MDGVDGVDVDVKEEDENVALSSIIVGVVAVMFALVVLTLGTDAVAVLGLESTLLFLEEEEVEEVGGGSISEGTASCVVSFFSVSSC